MCYPMGECYPLLLDVCIYIYIQISDVFQIICIGDAAIYLCSDSDELFISKLCYNNDYFLMFVMLGCCRLGLEV